MAVVSSVECRNFKYQQRQLYIPILQSNLYIYVHTSKDIQSDNYDNINEIFK